MLRMGMGDKHIIYDWMRSVYSKKGTIEINGYIYDKVIYLRLMRLNCWRIPVEH